VHLAHSQVVQRRRRAHRFDDKSVKASTGLDSMTCTKSLTGGEYLKE